MRKFTSAEKGLLKDKVHSRVSENIDFAVRADRRRLCIFTQREIRK